MAPILTGPPPHSLSAPQNRPDYLGDYFSASSATNVDCNRINIYSIAMCVILGNRKNIPEQTMQLNSKSCEISSLRLLSFSASKGRNSPLLPVLWVLLGPEDKSHARVVGLGHGPPHHWPRLVSPQYPGQETWKEGLCCRLPRMGLNIHCAQDQPYPAQPPACNCICPCEQHVPRWR